MSATQDTAGVIAPPPLLALAALALGLAANWAAPLGFLATLPAPVRYGLGAILILCAVFLFVFAVSGFTRARTPLQTRRATTQLVTTGIYAHTRNPIYVAFTLLLLGIACASAADWLIASTVLFALVIHYGVVKREERYLEAKFGDAYRRYQAHTPRYSWRLRA
jgi:protein-S-isoprenylcysteine O-methyltransferase Ste14